MKKLLAIVILGLILASCTQQNRNDEYICKFLSGKTKQPDVTLEIFKDQVNLIYSDGSKYRFSILEEKSDRIIFGYAPKNEDNMKQIFYKKTKNFFSVIYDCQKLN